MNKHFVSCKQFLFGQKIPNHILDSLSARRWGFKSVPTLFMSLSYLFFFLLLLFFCLTPSPILLYFISLYFISVSMPNLFFSKGSVEINKQAKWGENSVRFCLFLLSTKNICFFWEAISLVYYKHHCLPVRDNAYNLAFLSRFVDLLNLFAKKLLFWGESTGLI